MNKANECTCPSGDGSLVHPCPAHPAVEQAGGDERDFQAEGAQEVPSPVSQEYDRHLISLLRKGEALPGHQEEAADEIERLRDWNDHLNNTVLPNILNPNFLMLMKGGERLLDLCTKDGKFIGVSLNDMKDVFDWMVTHARIAPDHAALAQPSPASDLDPLNLAPHAEAFNEAPAEALKPEPAEADRPEVVAWQYRVTAGPQTGWSLWHPGKGEEFERSYTVERRPLMTVAQHERIVRALRAVITQLRQHKNDYMDAGQETYRALQNEIREREAEIARLDGLVSGRTAERDAALAEVERLRESKGDPSGSFDRCMKMMYERDENAKRLDAALARVAELERQQPVAWMHDQPNRVDVIHRDVKDLLQRVPGSSRGIYRPLDVSEHYTIPLYAAPVAQAQHSVPEGFRELLEMLVASDLRKIRYAGAWRREVHDRASSILALLAAAPGMEVPQAWLDVQAERRRQITAEGWTPEHDDLYCAAELPRAAAAYILNGANDEAPAIWPFSAKWWKPRDARSNYVRAGALILAEIERLDRAAPGKEGNDD
ncbi:hypothetical protein [Pseudomonas aeruginosa]|uniref:hypothetical protein n=1 Tax=Pseudomonas aeruginosa TaxID=287 RepID=UPI000B08C850|nr:hypothetical protein [Pseudomonas aeruginosa]